MFKKLFGWGKKKDNKKDKEIIETSIEYEENEPKISKVQLILRMLNNYKNMGQNFQAKLSSIKENDFLNIIEKIIVYHDKGQNEFNSYIISSNSILIDISSINKHIYELEKVDILNLKKTFYIGTDLVEEGFIYKIEGNLIFISFFISLFKNNLGIENIDKIKDEEFFIIDNSNHKVYIKDIDVKEKKYIEYPIYYLKNNLLYLNGFIYEKYIHIFDIKKKF